jgi:hypothetical protein
MNFENGKMESGSRFKIAHSGMGKKQSSGSVLILVLWAMVFLGLLAAISGTTARQQIILSDNIEKRTELYSLASSGAMIILDAVAGTEGKEVFLEEDLTKTLLERDAAFFGQIRLGGGYVSWGGGSGERGRRYFGLRDEGGKINVNFADVDILSRIFADPGGLDAASARELAKSVIDWRDRDDIVYGHKGIAGEKALYSKKGYEHFPRNKPFECIEELLLVDGMHRMTFARIRDHVTVFGDGKVNVNTADHEVFAALGVSRELAEKIIRYRHSGEGGGLRVFRDTQDLHKALEAERETEGFEEHMRNIDNLVLSGNIKTRAEVFSFLCAGKLDRGTAEGNLLCVFDRSGRLLYWGYFMAGRGI